MWANFETRCFYRIGAAGMAALEYEGGGGCVFCALVENQSS